MSSVSPPLEDSYYRVGMWDNVRRAVTHIMLDRTFLAQRGNPFAQMARWGKDTDKYFWEKRNDKNHK